MGTADDKRQRKILDELIILTECGLSKEDSEIVIVKLLNQGRNF
ncbi:MAG: hypothetical protein ABI462_12060 [Ignavibacteria bacterium]